MPTDLETIKQNREKEYFNLWRGKIGVFKSRSRGDNEKEVSV